MKKGNVVVLSDAELELVLAVRSKFKKCDECVDALRKFVELLEIDSACEVL